MSFDEEYRRDALDQFQADLADLCLGSGRKGKACGRKGWALCEWCLNDCRTDGNVGYWLAAHTPTFEYDADANQVGSWWDDNRQALAEQRERE